MLRKILGEAPFCAEMNEKIVVLPGRDKKAQIVFTNDSEYDLPLSCTLNVPSFINTDKCDFDVVVPAEGITNVTITFSVNINERLFGGEKIFELEIIDGIFDTKTLYEFEAWCEICYKCCDNEKEAFLPTEEVLFSKDAVLFGNRGEIISLEIPSAEKKQIVLHVISGKIKDKKDGETIFLSEGLNRILFEMAEDGSFEFQNPESFEKIYPDTLNTEYFM